MDRSVVQGAADQPGSDANSIAIAIHERCTILAPSRTKRCGAMMASQTAVFEGRPAAALDLQAVSNAMLGTQFGFLWLTRLGLLVVLTALLLLGGEITSQRDWIAARGEAFCWRRSLLFSSGARATWPRARRAYGRRPSP
jgi:putative copper export protein